MPALQELLYTDYGLFSLAVILFMLVMAVWFSVFFKRKIAESAKDSKAQ